MSELNHITLSDLVSIRVKNNNQWSQEVLKNEVTTLTGWNVTDKNELNRAWVAVNKAWKYSDKARVHPKDRRPHLPHIVSDTRQFFPGEYCPVPFVHLNEAEDDNDDDENLGIKIGSAKRSRKHYLDCCTKTQRTKTSKVYEELMKVAEEEGVSPAILCDHLKTQACYRSERRVSQEGKKPPKGGGVVQMDPIQASSLQQELMLGRGKYQALKRSLKTFVTLPSWKKLRRWQKSVTPDIKDDTLQTGVRVKYEEAITTTLESIATSLGAPWSSSITVLAKDGGDGSGNHAMYHQLANVNTHNIYIYMFSVLRVVDTVSDNVLYTNPAPNSPDTMRPLLILLGKEDDEIVRGDIERINSEKAALSGEGFQMGDTTVKLCAKNTMVDGNFRALSTGLGGAYCMMCKVTRAGGCGKETGVTPEDMCYITRSGKDILETYNKLKKPSGDVEIKQKDYSIRAGLTKKPLVLDEDALDSLISISPLHVGLRTLDFLLKLIYHLESGTHTWSESVGTLGRSKEMYTRSRQKLIDLVQSESGMLIDSADFAGKGGNTNKGDTVHRLLKKHRELLVDFNPVRHQDAFRELLEKLYACIKVYTSTQLVDVEAYKEHCLQTYHLLFNNFNNENNRRWIGISPTVHSLLAHSWEVIQRNGGRGMGEWSESGLEHNNKILRTIRTYLTRKTSQADSMFDLFTRMWVKSDPQLLSRRVPIIPRLHLRKVQGDDYRMESILDGLYLSDCAV